MTKGVLNVNLGLALGKHKLNYNVEHTGRGHVILIADVPYLPKNNYKKSEIPSFKEFQIIPNNEHFKKIEQVKEILDAYIKLLAIKKDFPIVLPDDPTIDITKAKELIKGLNIGILSSFFNLKASIEIYEIKQFLKDFELSLRVEMARGGQV